MNKWKESYKKENWAQEVQDNEDELLEGVLREEIAHVFKELSISTEPENYKDDKRLIESIIQKYKMIKDLCDYTKEDEKIHQEMIERLKEIEEKIKKEKDDRYVDIESKFEELAYAEKLEDERRIISDIIKEYEEMESRCGHSDEDVKVYQKLMEELDDIKYQINKEKYDRDSDSKSWNEYREEEKRQLREEEELEI